MSAASDDAPTPAAGADERAAVAEVAAAVAAEEAAEPESDGYRASNVNLEGVLTRDTEDESLRRYKASLLGAAVDLAAVSADTETRRVVVHALEVEVAGRPNVVVPLETPEQRQVYAKTPMPVKEGEAYVTKVVFSVHRDIVLGLQFDNALYKLGLRVDHVHQMMGSFPPRAERYEFRLPEREGPSGFFARGGYAVRTRVTDDDGNVYLDLNWQLEIRRTWPDGT